MEKDFVNGIIFGILFFFVFIIFECLITKQRRPKLIPNGILQRKSQFSSRETANWINIFLARINSSGIEAKMLNDVCVILTKKVMSSPNKPEALSNLKIDPLKTSDKTFFFSDFTINNSAESLTFSLHYQGTPSIQIQCSASTGFGGNLSKLFTINTNLELVMKMALARISLIFTEDNKLLVNIGNDLVIDFEIKPMLEKNQRNVESISSWLCEFIISELKGKSFPIQLE